MRYSNQIFFMLGALLIFNVFPTAAMAATPLKFLKPVGGECLKAGSTYTLEWTPFISGPNAELRNHYALSFLGDGSTFPLPNNGFASPYLSYYFAHNDSLTSTSLNWTVPSQTTNQGMVYIEYHEWFAGKGGDQNNPDDIRFAPEFGGGSFAQAGPFSIDNSAPTAPVLSSTKNSSNSVSLKWSVSVDAGCKELVGYKVLRDNKEIAKLAGNVNSYSDNNLTAGIKYTYKIVAYDNFHNTASNALVVTTAEAQTAAPEPVATVASTSKSVTISTVKVDGTQFALKNGELPAAVQAGKILYLEGAAAPNTTFILTVYSTKKTYEVTTDSTGVWHYELQTDSLESGDHRVTLAAKDAAGLAGEETEVMKFKLESAQASTATPVSENKSSSLWWIYVLLAVLLGIGVFTFFYIKKRKADKPNEIPVVPVDNSNL